VATFEEVLKRASRPEDVVPLVLDGLVVAEIRELERQLADAPLPTNLGERSQASVIAERIEDARTRMRDSEVPFRLRALPGREWTPLYDARPTKGKDETDEAAQERWFGWLCRVVAETVYDPVMTPEQVAQLVDQLPASSWGELSDRCWSINTGAVSVPFCATASVLMARSAPTSKQPSGSASPTAGGGAAKPQRQRRTSTTKKAG
jgi:hypothetical protein